MNHNIYMVHKRSSVQVRPRMLLPSEQKLCKGLIRQQLLPRGTVHGVGDKEKALDNVNFFLCFISKHTKQFIKRIIWFIDSHLAESPP